MTQENEQVRLYDFDTKSVTTIPTRELAPGMVKVQIRGLEGDYWVDGSKLKKSPPRHAPFGEEYQDRFAFLQATFHDVYPQTLEGWEDGFRRDANPAKQIEWWVNLAKVFKYFTDGKSLNKDERKDIFDLVLLACNNGPETVSLTFTPQVLSSNRMQKILDKLKNLWDASE